jgi:hypothetical protein
MARIETWGERQVPSSKAFLTRHLVFVSSRTRLSKDSILDIVSKNDAQDRTGKKFLCLGRSRVV